MAIFADSAISNLLIYIVPAQPVVTSIYPTTITIANNAGSIVDILEVSWQRNTSIGCSDEDTGNNTITDGSTSYDIMGLEEDSGYTITVTASNSAGTSEVIVTVMTPEAGKSLQQKVLTEVLWPYLQLHLPLQLL